MADQIKGLSPSNQKKLTALKAKLVHAKCELAKAQAELDKAKKR